MKKTGAILKKAREEKGLSLHEIGLSLKINSKILRAIEEGDEKNLPAKTFLRGFVQSYSNYLHIDTQMVLHSFYEEMGSTTPQPFIRDTDKKEDDAESSEVTTPPSVGAPVENKKEEEPVPVKVEKQEAEVIPMRQESAPSQKVEALPSMNDNRLKKSLGWLSVAVILVVSIGFTKKMIDKYSKEAEVPSAEVAQTMEGATPVISESVDAEDILEEALAEAETNSTETATPPANTADTKIEIPQIIPQLPTEPVKETAPAKKEEPKKEEVKVVEEKVEKKEEKEEDKKDVAKEEVKPAPSEKKEEAIQKPVELIVEALDAVEIEYASVSGKPQKIKLSSEQVHTFKSKSGLKINFSNGGAVNLILNGKDIGIPGDLGKPIKLAY
ncbi:hypothetical protein BDW_14055 [Bdellovibrio bacteriovorus W]|nr:hypothetical protein BDW_14055 [Bdellovibrio bacteriovorus W]